MKVDAAKIRAILERFKAVPRTEREPVSLRIEIKFSKSEVRLSVRGGMMAAEGAVPVEPEGSSWAITLDRGDVDKFFGKAGDIVDLNYTDAYLEVKSGSKAKAKLKRMSLENLIPFPSETDARIAFQLTREEDIEAMALALKYADKQGVYSHVVVAGDTIAATNRISAFFHAMGQSFPNTFLVPAKLANVFDAGGILKTGPAGLILWNEGTSIFAPRHMDAKAQDYEPVFNFLNRTAGFPERLLMNGDDLRSALRDLSGFDSITGAKLEYIPGETTASITVLKTGSEVTYNVGVSETDRAVSENFLIAAWLPFANAAGDYVILSYADEKQGPFHLMAQTGAQLLSARR